jgi:phosphonate ABC transporter permease subunit PhnE
VDKQKPSIWRSLTLGLTVFIVAIVYAYGVEVTDVDLSQLQDERRQDSMVRVIRSLFRPDIIAYEQEEVVLNAPLYVPCPAGELPEAGEASQGGSRLVVTPACAEPGQTVHVEGFGFYPDTEGPLRFVPNSDPASNVALGRTFVTTDANGEFATDLVLPDDRLSDDVQFIRVTMSRSVGAPYFTQTAILTWEKIIETVFLALLATTIGTVLAIPLSFAAARNLMRPVRSPLASIALNIIGWVVGIGITYDLAGRLAEVSVPYRHNLILGLVSVLAIPAISLVLFRWAVPVVEPTSPTGGQRAQRLIGLIAIGVLMVYWLFALAGLVSELGVSAASVLGPFAFLGDFLFHLGDILLVIAPIVAAVAGGAILGSLLSRLGQQLTERLPEPAVRILNLAVSSVAGATLLVLGGAAVAWLYEVSDPAITLWGPILIGAVAGALLALVSKPKSTLPVGLVLYYVTRTFLNTLRSIEALVMAIVFVIAVGIGPFAGMLALGLHTIVSLAKLYSEQVESIASGPMEAVQATGANRLQTIVYAVVPQIVPPYIAYTLYRWDINVRMSTIIGFVGGGGIGFLLQQNINLLNYRAASTQMLAIAIVVATLDYVSSVVRERYT